MKQRKPKVKDSLPDADPEVTLALISVLWETLNMNDAACARVVGVSRSTWRGWMRKPPTWSWWPFVIRQAIIMSIASITAKRGVSTKHRRNMQAALRRIDHLPDMQFDIQSRIVATGGAQAYLQRLLAKKPRKRSWIFKAANMGGYSVSAIERASRALEVVKKQKGFGDNKDSVWSLPSEKYFSRDLSSDTRADQRFED